VGRCWSGELDLSGNGVLSDDTIGSDNGGERFSLFWPFSGGKGNVLEGGIRVPTLLSWPSVLPPRQVSHAPVVTQDWTATFLELAGAGPHPDYPLDGESFVGHLFHGEDAPRHDLFWRMRGRRALRRGNLKYYQAPTAWRSC
jgi:arylsulfatase A-like enzyme